LRSELRKATLNIVIPVRQSVIREQLDS